MQDVVTVFAPDRNLRVQRFSQCWLAPTALRVYATLAHAGRKLTMRICGAAFPSPFLFATAADVHAQVNAQLGAQVDSQNNSFKREIKVPPDATCPLPIWLPIASEHGNVTVERPLSRRLICFAATWKNIEIFTSSSRVAQNRTAILPCGSNSPRRLDWLG